MNTTRRIEANEGNRAMEHVLVIGENRFGLAVAQYLTESAQSVTYASGDQPSGVVDGVEAINREITDASDVRALASEVTDVNLVIVTGSDPQALLTGHLVRRELDPGIVVAAISDPTNVPAFEGTGVEPIDMPRLLAEAIRNRYE